MRHTSTIISCLFLLTIFSCVREESAPEVEPKHWIEVYARFLAPDQAYKTELSVLEGDSVSTALPVAIEGDILVKGQTMIARQLAKEVVRYQADFNQPFAQALPLQIKGAQFAPQNLSFSFKPLPDFQVPENSISLANGGSVQLKQALQLAENEQLLLLISDSKKQTASITISEPGTIDTIKITKEQLTGLQTPGTASLYLLSKTRGQQTQKEITWNYLLEYYSEEQIIRLTP